MNDTTAAAHCAAAADRGASRDRVLLHLLFFASGAATLVYQVLWQRQLATLFGSGAQATAATLAVFFAGLSAGSWLWGRRAPSLADPLRTYALLEIGIAAAALLHAGLLPLYRALLPGLLATLPRFPWLEVIVKLGLAGLALAPATILMGGTLPVLGQLLVRVRGEFAATASLLVACNTLGAAAGALAAGFWLPVALGMRASNAVAMAVNVIVALLAFVLRGRRHARAGAERRRATDEAAAAQPTSAAFPAAAVAVIAAASGFATLALEVLWTRMFALVLNNSAYSFAAILVVFLLALAIGSLLAHQLCRRVAAPEVGLFVILLLAGAGVGTTPFVLWWATDGLDYLRAKTGFAGYVRMVFQQVGLVTFVPAVLCGSVLPYVVRLAQDGGHGAGPTLGRLFAINTAGGIAGALAAGFLVLPSTGLWGGIRAVALLYLVLALVVAVRHVGTTATFVAAVVLMLFVTVLDPGQLPVVTLDTRKQESVQEIWQTAHGVVAVVARPGDLQIKVDGSYTLGGRSSKANEETQADLPLLIAGRPRSAFFLGMGTGITPGAALRHPLERVTTAELIPEVATAAQRYFAADTGGLFTDPRSRIVIGDGRHVLLAEAGRYDVIVGDLFVPWHAGTGSLYTVEHFTTVRGRLNEGGTFAQWLPLYQMSARELFIIVRTMLEVFPRVTLWRGDFLAKQPIIALVGQGAGARMDPGSFLAAVRALGKHVDQTDVAVVALMSLFYAADLTANASAFADSPINTDDHPILEALAARTQSDVMAGRAAWLRGGELAELYARLLPATAMASDPYLAKLDAEQLGFVRAGQILYRSFVALADGDKDRARTLREEFRDLVPYGTYEMFRGRLARADEGP